MKLHNVEPKKKNTIHDFERGEIGQTRPFVFINID